MRAQLYQALFVHRGTDRVVEEIGVRGDHTDVGRQGDEVNALRA